MSSTNAVRTSALQSIYYLRRRATALPISTHPQQQGHHGHHGRHQQHNLNRNPSLLRHTQNPSLVQQKVTAVVTPSSSVRTQPSLVATTGRVPLSPLTNTKKDVFRLNGSNIRGHYAATADPNDNIDDTFSSSTTSSSTAESNLVVVLDMDECIIHSQFLTITSDLDNSYRQFEADRPPSNAFNFDEEAESIIPSACESFRLCLPDGDAVHVNKRPNLDLFLKELTSRYDTYIFTAAMEVYAAPLLDRLDPDNTMFRGRFYREHCTFDPELGVYVKDLNNIRLGLGQEPTSQQEDEHEDGGQGKQGQNEIGNDRNVEPTPTIFHDKRVVLVDNNPYSFLANPTNGILVTSFYDDPKDDTLNAVLDLLDELESEEDVRPVLDEKFGLEDALKEVAKGHSGGWR
mmetsp:Transcript_15914/g.18132  ORF Transcript_15914/g.18132 Transcript_15914/m.18132 type:complete len:402 (+) Transcript_15914:197-1402(+)